MVSFRSEAFSSIPLPPEVSFEQAFSRLDADSNSFYLHELADAVNVGMSKGGVWVRKRKSLTVVDAVRLFHCLFKGQRPPAAVGRRGPARL